MDLPLYMYPLMIVSYFIGVIVARPLATLVYRIRGKGKYLPY